MKEFLEVYERHQLNKGFKLEIYHTSIVDWCISIGYKSTHPQHGEEIFSVQESDCQMAFAKAQIYLKEWLLENNDGY